MKRSEVVAGNLPAMKPDMQRIVDHVYDVDLAKTYSRLESALTIGVNRTEFAHLVVHMDNAEINARDAHRLYLAVKAEREEYEAQYEPVRSSMWETALSVLQGEKDRGERRKAITDSDVRGMLAIHYPKEWSAYQAKLSKLQGVEEHMKELCELWKSRCRTIQTLLHTARK